MFSFVFIVVYCSIEKVTDKLKPHACVFVKKLNDELLLDATYFEVLVKLPRAQKYNYQISTKIIYQICQTLNINPYSYVE